jgi:hypothetical protein
MSSADLVKELTSNASLLLRRQIKLATLEARRDLTRRLTVAELLGSGSLLGLFGTIFLLVAALLAIGAALNGRYWAGALIVAAPLVLAAIVLGALGWSRRAAAPLSRTRQELHKEVSWAKHRTS